MDTVHTDLALSSTRQSANFNSKSDYAEELKAYSGGPDLEQQDNAENQSLDTLAVSRTSSRRLVGADQL